jgi:hypothetical protein
MGLKHCYFDHAGKDLILIGKVSDGGKLKKINNCKKRLAKIKISVVYLHKK